MKKYLKILLLLFVIITMACPPISDEPPLSSDATLLSITVNGTAIQDFSPEINDYNLSVINSVTDITVSVELSDTNAAYIVEKQTLSVGSDNICKIIVTAENDSKNTYTLTITREAPTISADATLKSITINGSELEGFSSEVISYNLSVGNSVTELTIDAEVNNSEATFILEKQTLSVGSDNICKIIVTAGDGSKKTYTINVTRASVNASADATLKSITINGSALQGFSSEATSYNLTVDNSVTELTVNAEVNNSEATFIVVKQTLIVGSNNICKIIVTAGDASKKTYIINITRASVNSSSDATLKSITINGSALQGFNSATTTYYLTVENSVTELTVSAEVNNDKDTFIIEKQSLVVGSDNICRIIVTAVDGETKTYTIYVTRASVIASSDATLKSITINGYALQGFSSDTTTYNLTVENSVTELTVNAEVNNSEATVIVEKQTLIVGSDNICKIIVTAGDGSNKTYIIIVTRSYNNLVTTVGYTQTNNDNKIATIWGKNRSELEYNSIISEGTSSFTENNNIFVGGYIKTSGSTLACYWKNGVKTILENSSYDSKVTDIFVLNDVVYASGYIKTSSNKTTPCYWENGVRTDLGNSGMATGIAVKDNTIAVSGFTDNSDVKVACYWINGVIKYLADPTYISEGTEIVFGSNTDVYISGYTQNFNSNSVACYWRNSSRIDLANNTYNSKASNITINGTSVYTSGYTKRDNNNSVACFWDNRSRTDLGNNSYQSASSSILYINNTLYVSGYTQNNGSNRVGCYWFNNTRVDLENNGYNSVANDIVYN